MRVAGQVFASSLELLPLLGLALFPLGHDSVGLVLIFFGSGLGWALSGRWIAAVVMWVVRPVSLVPSYAVLALIAVGNAGDPNPWGLWLLFGLWLTVGVSSAVASAYLIVRRPSAGIFA